MNKHPHQQYIPSLPLNFHPSASLSILVVLQVVLQLLEAQQPKFLVPPHNTDFDAGGLDLSFLAGRFLEG